MAAALPPPRTSRRISTSEGASNNISHTSLEILLRMGFPQHRSEKAIAATGDQGVQLASDWLLSHVKDPTIDDETPREYTIYLCPTGTLLTQLNKFWRLSKEQCDWNGALKYMPHITLCSFFTALDKHISVLTESLRKCVDRAKSLSAKQDLEHFVSSNYLGLFVSDVQATELRKFAEDYATEVAKSGIKVEPHKKQLHITLAYQFLPEHKVVLENLAKGIDVKADTRWEVRLYSRDPRAANCEVYKILFGHKPEMEDELELIPGDFVFGEKSSLEMSEDGWWEGTSWLTGMTGMLPGVFTEKTAESDAWTLHRSISLITTNHHKPACNNNVDGKPLYAQIRKKRKIFVMRHAERVDWAIGKDWILRFFDESGHYKPGNNTNIPRAVPIRDKPSDYIGDTPITRIGCEQARLIGEGLQYSGEHVSHAYSSPSLRCIQTTHNLLKGLGVNLPIRVEGAFFEWFGWHTDHPPKFMTPEKLSMCGYNIDISYKPMVSSANFNYEESTEECYVRMYSAVREILKSHYNPGGNILIIGHAANLDCCTRQLTGLSPRPCDAFTAVVRSIPYCGLVMCEEETPEKYTFVQPPIEAPLHQNNKKFDWTYLTRTMP